MTTLAEESVAPAEAQQSALVLENSNTYWDWLLSHNYLMYGMQRLVAQQIQDFIKYPPRQKPASFNLDAVMRQLEDMHSSKGH